MKNKGFTLVELLAVVTLLVILALIVTPKVLEQKNRKEKEISDAQKQVLFSDAKRYLRDNKSDDIKPEAVFCVNVNTLINENYISMDAEDFKDEIIKVTVDENSNLVTSLDKNCSVPSQTSSGPVSFATDSWDMIAANTSSDKYKVGDTKCIKLNGFTTTNNNGCSNGEFKVRIANKTACTTEESQTACGFVVEFVDIITEHNMNPSGEYKGTQYDYGWNVDGYPASAMYQEYFASNATNSLYAKLPSDLQSKIINTTVVSGHGSTSGETNFTSQDKLYLLSPKEVGFDLDYDTAKTETRLLDYYNNHNSDASRIKQYNGSNKAWWLRSASSYYANRFCSVFTSGCYNRNYASSAYGVAPAFRIGS